MSVNIRYPNITGFTEKEQLAQVKSYLRQLVDQLNYILPTLGNGEAAAQVGTTSYHVQGQEMSYYDLRSLIIQELQEVEKLFNALSARVLTVNSGTANGWAYKKWDDGSYEMFGEFVVSATQEGTASGGMFLSEPFVIQTPFAIESAIVSGSANDLFTIINADMAETDSDNNISFNLLRSVGFDANTEITVRLHAAGKFKAGGTA